ncbi:MAG: hypothetical protein WCI79_00635 [Candidatus Saccharibacteria bacterium]
MNKILTLGLGTAVVVAAGIIAVPALAQGQKQGTNGNGGSYGYQQNIETKAKLIGITADELKTQLATKTMLQIAADKGISEDDFHASMQKSAQERWASKGLTQAEIDSRLQNMTERQASDHDSNSANRGGMQNHRYNQ